MRRITKNRWLLVIIMVVLLWPLAAWVAAKGLIVHAEVSRADAIVVLAGSSTYIERTHAAAKLFSEGRAPLIVLTNDNIHGGWSVEQQRNPLFIERAANELAARGVERNRIELISTPVTSTYDEVVRIRDYARSRGWRSIIVVTSSYQSRRALWTLKRVFQGEDVALGMSAAPPGEQSPSPAIWWCSRMGWKSVAGEYAKMVYYRVKY
jgi:uncharacterized SAM-binding protein YcdF (DUF218 family)